MLLIHEIDFTVGICSLRWSAGLLLSTTAPVLRQPTPLSTTGACLCWLVLLMMMLLLLLFSSSQ